MKREKRPLPIKVCYEPNRFSKDNLANAYETLCPEKQMATPPRVKNDIHLVNVNQQKIKRA